MRVSPYCLVLLLILGVVCSQADAIAPKTKKLFNIGVVGAPVRGEVVRIGSQYHEVTPQEADLGDGIRDSINRYLNEHPEVGGRIKLVYGNEATKLADKGKLDAVLCFGHARIKGVTDKDQVLHMEVNMDKPAEYSLTVAAGNAIRKLGYKNVAIIRGSSKNPELKKLANAFFDPIKVRLDEDGISYTAVAVPMEGADYKSAIKRLNEHKYEAVVLVPFIDANLFLSEYKELNCETPIVSSGVLLNKANPIELAEGRWYAKISAPASLNCYNAIKLMTKVLQKYDWDPRQAQQYLDGLKKQCDAGKYFIIDDTGCFDAQVAYMKVENGQEKQISLSEIKR